MAISHAEEAGLLRTMDINNPMNRFSHRQWVVRANSSALHIVAFVIGFMSFIHFKLVGDLYPVEFVLALMIPLLWPRKSTLLRNPQIKIILFFGFLWFASQVSTDLIRSTPTTDLLRGWASILFFLIDFIGLYMLVSCSVKRIMIFLLGYMLGGLLQPSLLPSMFFDAYPWKFGYSFPVTLALLLVIAYYCDGNLRKLKWWTLPLGALGVLSFYLDFRSLGAIILLTGFLIYFRGAWLGRLLSARFRHMYILMTAIILMGVSIGITKTYEYSVEHGWLGEHIKNKYDMQAGGKLGLLFGGRAESIASIPAIVDSPIIGHGSWAKDPYYRNFLYDLIDLGYSRSEADIEHTITKSDLIPAHSHILQAWVWAGVFGAIFWVVVLWIVLRTMIQTYRLPNSLFVIALFFSLLAIWDIFFSPFGAMMRIQWAFRLTVFLISYQMSQHMQINLSIK